MWCSHIEYSSMSRTRIMFECSSSNMASPMTVSRILLIAVRKERHRARDTLRGLEKPFARRVLAKQSQLLANDVLVFRQRSYGCTRR